ncbi:MAG: type I methionyl aminopeptidase [Bacilli bacterium]|nr:type I methionyl aminopeptidase [Bacilli bacterium]
MISIKSEREIDLMRHAGHINYLTHEEIKKHVKAGITTKELDKIAYDFITKNDCVPSFLNYEGYPASICTSINDEVVHGIPGNTKLKNGDIISIDVGVAYKNYHSDAARTYIIGEVDNKIKKLVEKTEESLYEGLKVIKAGAKIGDIGAAISEVAHQNGLSVVRELVGHGVGISIHEDPDVPNFGKKNTGLVLKAGMTIAVEPMLNLGERYVYMEDDDWTIKTDDGSPSAHFEHTVLVTDTGYEILTGEK